jgi:hypothetical protein
MKAVISNLLRKKRKERKMFPILTTQRIGVEVHQTKVVLDEDLPV